MQIWGYVWSWGSFLGDFTFKGVERGVPPPPKKKEEKKRKQTLSFLDIMLVNKKIGKVSRKYLNIFNFCLGS